MDNRMIFENYLLVLKSTVEVYVHGTLESSNQEVRNVLKDGLVETISMQGNTYDIMAQNNWYQVNNIDVKEISKTLNKLLNEN